MIISDQRSVCACESASRRQDAALSSSSPTLRTVVARGPWRLSEVRSPHLYARAETVSNSSHGLDGPPKGYRPVWRLPHPALVGAPPDGAPLWRTATAGDATCITAATADTTPAGAARCSTSSSRPTNTPSSSPSCWALTTPPSRTSNPARRSPSMSTARTSPPSCAA